MEFELIHAWEYHVSTEEIYLFLLDMCNAVSLEVVGCETEINYINIIRVKDVTIRLRKLF